MAFDIILSEKEGLRFSFDEKRLYRNGQPAPHILENTPLEIFKYLTECSPNYVTHQDIVEEIWTRRLKKAFPVGEPSETIKMHVMSIRKYLGDISPFKYIESGYKSYKCNFERVFVDYHHLDQRVNELCRSIDELTGKLADIQKRIDQSPDERWKEIYTAQFNSTYILFQQKKYNLDSFVAKYKDIYFPEQPHPQNALLCVKSYEAKSEEIFVNISYHREEIKQLGRVIDDLFVTYPPDEIFPG